MDSNSIDLTSDDEFVQDASETSSVAASSTVSNSQQGKTWIFTINNYTEGVITNMKCWEVQRMLVSKEVGASGTRHLQGAVTFKRKYRFAALKKLMPTAHIQLAVAADCFNYVAKTDSEVVININNASQGKRSDLKDAIETLKASGLKAVAQGHEASFVRYNRGFKELQQMWDRPGVSAWKPGDFREVIYIWGPSGTGKTKLVVDECGYGDLWMSPTEFTSNNYFGDYAGHKYALFDDFRGSCLKFATFLRYIDRYPVIAWVKGAHEKWVPERIYITSVFHWSNLYKSTELGSEPLEQLKRRITKVIHFTEAGVSHECTDKMCGAQGHYTAPREQANQERSFSEDFADYGL